MNVRIPILLFGILCLSHWGMAQSRVQVGADRLETWLPALEGKRVALAVNHTSRLTGTTTHLVDTLLARGVEVVALFAPEHGLRGTADAGETLSDGKDSRTGLPVYSLYGRNKKPAPEQLADVDVLIFDIQDVGARFYTYITTLYYLMQASAEEGVSLWVLDRPNPCDYVDGRCCKILCARLSVRCPCRCCTALRSESWHK